MPTYQANSVQTSNIELANMIATAAKNAVDAAIGTVLTLPTETTIRPEMTADKTEEDSKKEDTQIEADATSLRSTTVNN